MSRLLDSRVIWFIVLIIFWLAMSGIYNSLLVSMGIASAAFVTYIGQRLDQKDADPFDFTFRPTGFLAYVPWLIKEATLANIDVAKRALAPTLSVNPVVASVTTGNLSEMGRVTYANSITLTPGTVSINVQRDYIVVHAISQQGMLELQQGNMLKRIERFASLTVADGTALEQTSTSQDVTEDTSSRIAFETPSLNLKVLFDDRFENDQDEGFDEPRPIASKATGKNKHDGEIKT